MWVTTATTDDIKDIKTTYIVYDEEEDKRRRRIDV